MLILRWFIITQMVTLKYVGGNGARCAVLFEKQIGVAGKKDQPIFMMVCTLLKSMR